MREKLIVFGSPGMGEIIHTTPLLKILDRQYDVTLVVHEWQEPAVRNLSFYTGRVVAYNDKQAAYGGRIEDGAMNRCLRLSKEFADSLNLPGAKWLAPVLRHGVVFNDNFASTKANMEHDVLVPNGIYRQDIAGQQHRSFPEKLCRSYGYETDDLRMYVSPPHSLKHAIKNTGQTTVALCNSAETLRRMPWTTIAKLMCRFTGVRFLLVGYQGDYPVAHLERVAYEQNNTLEFHTFDTVSNDNTDHGIAAIHASDIVIGPDCGWSYVGLAAGKPGIILQSRAHYEGLVPRQYWPRVGMYEIAIKTCDRMCDAQRLVVAVESKQPELKRPYLESEDWSLMTQEWKDNVYCSGYPRTLNCYTAEHAPCLDYTEDDFYAIIRMMVMLCPKL